MEMIYKKNRKSLKELKVVMDDKRKIDLSDVKVDNSDLEQDCETVSKKLKLTQDNFEESKKKAQRLVDAYKMLSNVEEAAKAHEELFAKANQD